MPSIIVTGAGSGIGAATCRQLAKQGTDLIIHTGQREQAVQALAQECHQLNHSIRILIVTGDLSLPVTSERLVSAAVRQGGLCGLVANAGFSDGTSLLNLADEQLMQSLQPMLFAFLRLARLAQPALKANGGGGIVAVSSFVAHRYQLAPSTCAATAATKSSIEALVKAAAVEMAADGITVNAVAPGFVNKDNPLRKAAFSPDLMKAMLEKIPMKRLCVPTDIAAAIVFFLSESARMITGQVLSVDGGLTL